MQNILIISENVNLINLLQTDKERLSFVISCSQISLPEVKSLLLKNCCLVILNMPMTEEKSFALLHEIRKVHNVPILIVSTNTDVLDLVCAIRMDADDYLISPFEDSVADDFGLLSVIVPHWDKAFFNEIPSILAKLNTAIPSKIPPLK